MRETDTSRAREFIWKNKEKYTFAEMTKKILEMTTKLNERSVKTLICKTLDPSLENFVPPTGKRSIKAQEYITENLETSSKEAITEYIINNMRLSKYTAMRLYDLIKQEKEGEKREKQKEKEKENNYKGRKRNFFYIDDSKLWRSI